MSTIQEQYIDRILYTLSCEANNLRDVIHHDTHADMACLHQIVVHLNRLIETQQKSCDP